MTLTIELPDPLAKAIRMRPNGNAVAMEAALNGIAAALSQPDTLRQRYPLWEGTAPPPKTGAELVAYWNGENLFGSRADIEGDSSEYARALREKAAQREGMNW